LIAGCDGFVDKVGVVVVEAEDEEANVEGFGGAGVEVDGVEDKSVVVVDQGLVEFGAAVCCFETDKEVVSMSE